MEALPLPAKDAFSILKLGKCNPTVRSCSNQYLFLLLQPLYIWPSVYLLASDGRQVGIHISVMISDHSILL